jgi:hypothetical protein
LSPIEKGKFDTIGTLGLGQQLGHIPVRRHLPERVEADFSPTRVDIEASSDEDIPVTGLT